MFLHPFAQTAYASSVPERCCAVTVRDEKGAPQTIEVLARSTHHAASLFIGQARAKLPGQNLPLPNERTIFEIRLIGEQRVYRVLGERVQQWANEQARKQNEGVYERIDRRRSRSGRG